MGRHLLAAGFLLVALSADAGTAPLSPKSWKDSAEISFINANGNSKTTTASAKNSLSYDLSPRMRFDLDGGGLGSRANGEINSEQYFAQEKLSSKFYDRDYVLEKYRWDKNRFAGILSRQEFSLGLGRELIKAAKDLLIGELAPGYVNEERQAEKRKSYAALRFYAKFTHEFSPTSKFSQDAEYLQGLSDKRDNRLGTETSVTTMLTSLLSIKTTLNWRHSGQPPSGNIKDDTITSFALIANF